MKEIVCCLDCEEVVVDEWPSAKNATRLELPIKGCQMRIAKHTAISILDRLVIIALRPRVGATPFVDVLI